MESYPRPKTLDLFSGIGGFALAFEAAGFETKAFAEIESYPSRILTQHWPHIPNLGDVRGIDGKTLRGSIDVVCGGFPCQDISLAGKGAGINGQRSGLWFEMVRIIAGARPTFCLIENVPALRTRGYDAVQTTLEEAGYKARPFVVGAIHAGAPHKRSRVWIMAYRNDARQSTDKRQGQARNNFRGRGEAVPDTMPERKSLRHGGKDSFRPYPEFTGVHSRSKWPAWNVEPDVGRVAYGIPKRVDRIKALGNAVVPAVVYPFAKFIYQELMKHGPTGTT